MRKFPKEPLFAKTISIPIISTLYSGNSGCTTILNRQSLWCQHVTQISKPITKFNQSINGTICTFCISNFCFHFEYFSLKSSWQLFFFFFFPLQNQRPRNNDVCSVETTTTTAKCAEYDIATSNYRLRQM